MAREERKWAKLATLDDDDHQQRQRQHLSALAHADDETDMRFSSQFGAPARFVAWQTFGLPAESKHNALLRPVQLTKVSKLRNASLLALVSCSLQRGQFIVYRRRRRRRRRALAATE